MMRHNSVGANLMITIDYKLEGGREGGSGV